MKYFGEFLIEKSIINEEQLAFALIKQNKNIPPTAEIILEKKLLTPNEILKIFKKQVERNIGFIESAKLLDLWRPNLEQSIKEVINKIRIPLGEILVNMECTTVEVITSALDDFLIEQMREETNSPIDSRIDPQIDFTNIPELEKNPVKKK